MTVSTIRVRREGGRGFHLINKAAYDANPSAFTVVKDDEVHMVDGKLQLKRATAAPAAASGSGSKATAKV